MGKYVNYSELSSNAPVNWAKNTDPSKYREGLERIAPPGKKPKAARVSAYEAHTTEKEGRKWLENWTTAMFE